MKAYVAVIYDCRGGSEDEVNRSDPIDNIRDATEWARDCCNGEPYDYTIEEVEV